MSEDLAWDCRTDEQRFYKLQDYCKFLRSRLKYMEDEKYKNIVIEKLDNFMLEIKKIRTIDINITVDEAQYLMDKLDLIYKMGAGDRHLDNIWSQINNRLVEKAKEIEVKE